MAACQDCGSPVVFLKKPEGGWLPPVEPLFDFAYNDHYIASVDGIAQSVPQVYKRHECMSWEERQLKVFEREREKQELIAADRLRRAEEARVAQELEEARRAQEEAVRRLNERLELEERQRQARAARKRRRKEAERAGELAAKRFPDRLLPFACRDCEAQPQEACRTDLYGTRAAPYLWWQRSAHTARYQDAPPDDRSTLHATERWGDDYDAYGEAGSTPETCGPWPPARLQGQPHRLLSKQQIGDLAGAYDMRDWLRRNYLDVFTPEKRWLTDGEQRNLTEWLHQFGGVFDEIQEVKNDGPDAVAGEDPGAGAEGVRGRDAGGARSAEEAGDQLHPPGRAGAGPGAPEQGDRGAVPGAQDEAR